MMACEKMSGYKNLVCVASGKGGVGKSTTAVNLALSLSKLGKRVGLLDADIYGPSIPLMMGIEPGRKPEIRDRKFMLPIIAHDIEINSMGLLVDEKTAMAWRAPMIISAFNQILNDTVWDNRDYLIVDMPPGTGDIQLSLSQSAEIAGALIVTTPQDVALLDARRAIEMFKKVEVPIIGIVENMSVHICEKCGHEEEVFGSGGGVKLATEYKTEVIGRLPLNIGVRERTDAGKPIVQSLPSNPASKAYMQLSITLDERVSQNMANGIAKPIFSVTED